MINLTDKLFGIKGWLRRHAADWARGNGTLLKLAVAMHDPFRHPRLATPLPQDRVLVVAPHADDEAIGCAGAVLLHLQGGGSVAVVYLSDGSLGDARLHDDGVDMEHASQLRTRIRMIRREEAGQWCNAAGVTMRWFLDGPDGQLSKHRRSLGARLAVIINEWQPSLIYLPSPLDNHRDHIASNHIVMLALAQASRRVDGAGPTLRGYEVWSLVVTNLLIDISAVFARKLELLAIYQSQLKDINYTTAVAGLAAYRAMGLPQHSGHAEAFVEMNVAFHAKILRALEARSAHRQAAADLP